MLNYSAKDWARRLPFVGNVRINHHNKVILYYQGKRCRRCAVVAAWSPPRSTCCVFHL